MLLLNRRKIIIAALRLGIVLLVISYGTDLKAQDSTMLLTDMNVQIEATEAVNDMYNFKFRKAEQQYRWLKQKYPDHPLPYFMMGLNEWWKIAPNIAEKRHDKRLIAYMDTVILLAEARYSKDEGDIEAAFFLSAANAFKGRLYSERREWSKAAVVGKNALKYLEASRGQHELSPEFLFGDALYNYYSVWIPENYPLLKPILWFFTKG